MTPQEALKSAVSEKGVELYALLAALLTWSDTHIINTPPIWKEARKLEQQLRNRSLELQQQPSRIECRATYEEVSPFVLATAERYAWGFSDGDPVLNIETALDMMFTDSEEHPSEVGSAGFLELMSLLNDLAENGYDEVTLGLA